MKWNRMIAIFLMLLCACSVTSPAEKGSLVETDIPIETPHTNIPNPASIYCEQQGNKLELRTTTDGSQYGACIFQDGSECEEWKYYHGECTPVAAQGQPGAKAITVDTIGDVERLHTLAAHSDKVTDVTFSGDGLFLASSGRDGKIRLWDTQSWQEAYSFNIDKSDLNVVSFSPDGKMLASSESIWDVTSKQVIHPLKKTGEVGHVAFSPDGYLLAVAGFPQEVTLWDVTSGQMVRIFEKQDNIMGFFGVVFSPDSKLLAAGSNGGSVTVWDVTSGKITGTLKHGDESGVHDVAFSPDGRLLAGGGTGSAVRIWEIASGETVQTLWLNNGIYGLAFSPDGSILALASCNRVAQLWSVESGTVLANLPHADELMAVAFSPDGALLATGGYDNNVVIWGIKR